ncbi:Fanconi anemia core complex-associated protein 20 [Ochotona princeps]|uniref:Fanconi anemia core complex-associated protein 20 n=1 Tax=Ochotona princeps TaxID=9978 RepID=UPI0027154C55|nr:Fanconi anemia core complex-associated protein 20 [Ochotona princeps]
MEAAKRPRLRLSRRKPPSEDGAPPLLTSPALSRSAPRAPAPPPGRPGPPAGSEDAPWTELLRTAGAELRVDGEVPPLPAFPGQEPGPEPAAPLEAFTVGSQTFSWPPFPQAAGRPGAGERLGTPTRSPRPETPSRLPEAPALPSCPMCQEEFGPELVQLDIDSHLAQCLAESAEDVFW